MPSTRTPVAIGSRVPAWPTLRVAHRRRARPTTSWLVQPDGLSTTSRPSGAGIRAVVPGVVGGSASNGDLGVVVRVCFLVLVLGLGLAVGVGVAGVGRTCGRRGHGLVAFLGLTQQVLHVRRGLGDRVREEVEAGGEPDLDLLPDERTQSTLVLLQ